VLPPAKKWEPKTWEIALNFLPLPILIANISGMRQHIQNRKEVRPRAIPAAFDEKSSVNFGPLTTWITYEFGHTKMHFLGDYISATRRCCALKFLHTLEIDKALLAHIRTGTGVFPKKYNRENLKFGLKFSVCAPITSRLVGVPSRNFSRPRAA